MEKVDKIIILNIHESLAQQSHLPRFQQFKPSLFWPYSSQKLPITSNMPIDYSKWDNKDKAPFPPWSATTIPSTHSIFSNPVVPPPPALLQIPLIFHRLGTQATY